jgi:hypothetical protein
MSCSPATSATRPPWPRSSTRSAGESKCLPMKRNV